MLLSGPPRPPLGALRGLPLLQVNSPSWLHMCLDSGFLGVSEVGRVASLLGVDGWTDRFGEGEGKGQPPGPRAQQDWHRKPCSRFPVWARPGQGPRRGWGEAWTCHQRPLGKVPAQPLHAGCWALPG